MIPKIIHYCWFGHNSKPELAEKCMQSWKKYCPDYRIIEWNEDNYDLSHAPLYVKQAYETKKWAFVSDYVRFDVLYKFGGLYLDTDVELLKPLTPIICNGPFMGCEVDGKVFDSKPPIQIRVNPGIGLGAEPGMQIYKEIMDIYTTISFLDENGVFNGKTVVEYTTGLLMKHGLQNLDVIQSVCGLRIYPTEFFCPRTWRNKRLRITNNTYSIHHFAASWYTKEDARRRRYFTLHTIWDGVKHTPKRIARRVLGDHAYETAKRKLKKKQ